MFSNWKNDWQKRRVVGKNRNLDGVFLAVLNSRKNKEQFQQFKQKIHPFVEKEFQTYMGQNNVCFFIVDQDLFNKIMQLQTDFVQNFRWVPSGQPEKKANMSKPRNQESLSNVPKENWREVMKTNQNLPIKPVIVQDANEQEKVLNELKNKRFIYRWVKKK